VTTARQLKISVAAAIALLILLGAPLLPTSERRQVVQTYTTQVATILDTRRDVQRSWIASDCTNARCPYIDSSSAVLKEYGTLAIDVTVHNPTSFEVRDLVVRFDFWKSSSCLTCPPNYTDTIRFDKLPASVAQSIHLEIRNDLFRFGYSQRFYYKFQINTYVVSIEEQVTATTIGTSSAVQTITVSHLIPLGELIHLGMLSEPQLFAGIGILGFFSAMMLTRVLTRSRFRHGVLGSSEKATNDSSTPPRALGSGQSARAKEHTILRDMGSAMPPAGLDPEFLKYRDRLQESLMAGKIDEVEYVRLLAEFDKAKRKKDYP
jgi:hypothetical protein